jgi:hypothetical protein
MMFIERDGLLVLGIDQQREHRGRRAQKAVSGQR